MKYFLGIFQEVKYELVYNKVCRHTQVVEYICIYVQIHTYLHTYAHVCTYSV